MKILFVGSTVKYALEHGLINGFLRQHHDVKVYSNDKVLRERTLIDRLKGLPLRMINLPVLNKPTDNPVLLKRGITHWHREWVDSNNRNAFNEGLKQVIRDYVPELVFFFHLHIINESVPRLARSIGAKNFAYFPDDAFAPELYTQRADGFVRAMDAIFTTKSFNVDEFKMVGVPNVIFMNKGYNPGCHHPVTPTPEDYQKYGGDVVFVGTAFESWRIDFMARLVDACPNVKFRIFGSKWGKTRNPRFYISKPARFRSWRNLAPFTGEPIICEDMSLAFATNKICLALLKQGTGSVRMRDYQTSRSIEIPACKGFMLAEYTDEHAELFKEDKEAVYFRSFDQLVEKIQYYLEHDDERRQIVEAGYQRAMTSGYSYYDYAQQIIEVYNKL